MFRLCTAAETDLFRVLQYENEELRNRLTVLENKIEELVASYEEKIDADLGSISTKEDYGIEPENFVAEDSSQHGRELQTVSWR